MGFEVDFDSASPGIYIEKSGETVRKIVKHRYQKDIRSHSAADVFLVSSAPGLFCGVEDDYAVVALSEHVAHECFNIGCGDGAYNFIRAVEGVDSVDEAAHDCVVP